MTQKSELGKLGEDLACEYLVDKGYKILERNFRKPWGELDIVAKARDRTLVFVEVKTIKYHFSQGLRPEDQMTREKIKKFKRTATLYAGHRKDLINDRKGWRLDLLALIIKPENLTSGYKSYDIRHYENI